MKKSTKQNYIGNVLRKCRIEKDLTQEEVSAFTGIAPKYLSQLERGLSKGSVDTLIKFCDFFNITPNILLGDLLKTPVACDIQDFSHDYTKLNSDNKEVVDNLVTYLLKAQSDK